MAIRFVRSAGNITEPAVIEMAASGVIYPNSVVVRDAATNVVATAAAAGMTTTSIFGVSLDYVQGASDTFVRVIPFVPGQIWDVDTANAISTASILLRHTMVNSLVVRNIVGALGGDGESATAGIFLAYAVTGLTTGSGRLLGTFLTQGGVRKGGAYDIL